MHAREARQSTLAVPGNWENAYGAFAADLHRLAAREQALRTHLAGERSERRQRDEMVESTLQGLQSALAALQQDVLEVRTAPARVRRAIHDLDYQRVIERVREAANMALPLGARIVVISKGDDALLELNGRAAGHFLQDQDGVYAGHHPADSAEAIDQLERLRAAGTDYLIIPSTGFWWLGHYSDFGRHLESRYRRIQADRYCMIYELGRRRGWLASVWRGLRVPSLRRAV